MKKINSSEVEFKLVGKGTYWEVRQKVYLFGIIPYWSKFYWGANEWGKIRHQINGTYWYSRAHCSQR